MPITKPIDLQVFKLEFRIRGGELAPGARLPSARLPSARLHSDRLRFLIGLPSVPAVAR